MLCAVACSAPPSGRARWTLQLLADEMVRLTVHKRISDETISSAARRDGPQAVAKEDVVHPEGRRRNLLLEWRMCSRSTPKHLTPTGRSLASPKHLGSSSAKRGCPPAPNQPRGRAASSRGVKACRSPPRESTVKVLLSYGLSPTTPVLRSSTKRQTPQGSMMRWESKRRNRDGKPAAPCGPPKGLLRRRSAGVNECGDIPSGGPRLHDVL